MSRPVWLFAARQMMLDHNIPAMTFPLDEMDTASLEFLSLSPIKLLLTLETASNDPGAINNEDFTMFNRPKGGLHPHSVRVLYAPEDSDFSVPGHASAFMAPGGRFLVTQSPMSDVQLWDIGVVGFRERCKVLASCNVSEQANELLGLSPSTDGRSFYLFSADTDVYGLFFKS